MLQVKLNDLHQSHLVEAGQSTASKFALMTQNPESVMENLCPLIQCRDYFNDMLFVQYHDEHKLGKIHGWHWEYHQQFHEELITNEYIYLLFNYDADQYKSFNALFELEEEMGMKKTEVIPVEIVGNEIESKYYDDYQGT